MCRTAEGTRLYYKKIDSGEKEEEAGRKSPMFTGREAELNYLKGYYDRVGSQIIVLYGSKGVGKTTLIEQFLEGKSYLYYEAVCCSTRQQLFYLGQHLEGMGLPMAEYPSFEEIFALFSTHSVKKQVLVIDEVQNFCKTDTLFFEALCHYLTVQKEHGSLFVILCSSSICCWDKDMLTYEDYERFLFCQKQARIHADYVALFSRVRFDQAIQIEAKKNPCLLLLTLEQLNNN